MSRRRSENDLSRCDKVGVDTLDYQYCGDGGSHIYVCISNQGGRCVLLGGQCECQPVDGGSVRGLDEKLSGVL